MSTLADSIEAFLKRREHWVSADDLCVVFQVDPRQLRSTDGRPGLCSAFAISGSKGFRHIEHCTEVEWQHFHDRMRKHGIAELVRVKTLRKRREALAAQPVFKLEYAS